MVDMAMNIKSPEAHRLATELARVLGISITEAVTKALRDALLRAQMKADIDPKLRALIADMQERMQATGINAEDLYDPETGLPR